ncbi:helix-turn-helix domain-containing protein [Nocardioides sp. NPDC047086]|uniref:helix-turn-helix domain-containing protein n=1 Tax=Nocardioides sp. NPDC047086 TaxID=3154810 RepID=UPI003411A052
MQDLLGRIARLDPSASLGLRVIACFDELIVGNVNTRALLAAAASLAGCAAGFGQSDPARVIRVGPKGELLPGQRPAPAAEASAPIAEGMVVWLEREGAALANDAIILERLALAVRIRHGRGPREVDNRRHLGILTDREASDEERLAAAGAIGLVASHRYRVVAAPLFAVWSGRPSGPEDVIGTRYGPIHALVIPETYDAFDASPSGIGAATTVVGLHHSFRTALVALRLSLPPAEPQVLADTYGGLVELLAEAGDDAWHHDAECLDAVARHAWGMETVDALVMTQSVREAARMLGIHHSTMQSRLDTIAATLGFNPIAGFGRSRLGIAYLQHRMRRSTVLDLPAPSMR